MELSREEKLDALERVLHSRSLNSSESLKSFLRFVALKAIDDQASYLKEYTIATEVFGRKTNYDSRSDSVVRVQAGRLRTKLQEYYAGEGKHDRVLIDLPKGKYTPVFSYQLRFETSTKATELLELRAVMPVWDYLLRSPEPILISFSNTLFEGTVETGMRLLKSLDSPTRGVGSHAIGDNTARVVTEHYTGIGEAMGIYYLADLFAKTRQ